MQGLELHLRHVSRDVWKAKAHLRSVKRQLLAVRLDVFKVKARVRDARLDPRKVTLVVRKVGIHLQRVKVHVRKVKIHVLKGGDPLRKWVSGLFLSFLRVRGQFGGRATLLLWAGRRSRRRRAAALEVGLQAVINGAGTRHVALGRLAHVLVKGQVGLVQIVAHRLLGIFDALAHLARAGGDLGQLVPQGAVLVHLRHIHIAGHQFRVAVHLHGEGGVHAAALRADARQALAVTGSEIDAKRQLGFDNVKGSEDVRHVLRAEGGTDFIV